MSLPPGAFTVTTSGWRWRFSFGRGHGPAGRVSGAALETGHHHRNAARPIADKLLVSAALISLVQVRVLPGWMAILIIGREFAVSGLRAIAAAEGYTIRANDLGKTKMLSQVVAISCMLLSVRHPALLRPGMILMWGVVFFALLSAFSYFGKFWHKVDEGVKNRRRRELLTLERKRQRAAMRRHRGSRGAGAWARLRSRTRRSELNRPHLPLGTYRADGFSIQRNGDAAGVAQPQKHHAGASMVRLCLR